LVVYFAAFLIIDFLASAIAFALERRQPKPAKMDGSLLKSGCNASRTATLFSSLDQNAERAIQGKPFAWDKLERTAAVNYVPPIAATQ